MPTLFVGHGSPMNALGNNTYAKTLASLGQSLPTPRAILVISAHWRTTGVEVVGHRQPETIYDFSGFSPELYKIKYPAPGAPEVATEVATALKDFSAKTTLEWGFDHGTWTVLMFLYPEAKIPVLQLSINKRATFAEHFAIGKALAELRKNDILILGSGNITHNLGEVDWEGKGQPFEWAVEFDRYIKQAILAKNVDALVRQKGKTEKEWRHAHPTSEHYIPLLYACGAAAENAQVQFFNETMDLGSLSMRCVLWNSSS